MSFSGVLVARGRSRSGSANALCSNSQVRPFVRAACTMETLPQEMVFKVLLDWRDSESLC